MANNSEFWERYQDPRWQRKRLEIMQRDNWKCKCCGTDGDTLNVHHAYYERDAMPWEYPDHALVTLCKECHDQKHAAKKTLLVVLAHLPTNAVIELLGFGLAHAAYERELSFTMGLDGLEDGVVSYFAGGTTDLGKLSEELRKLSGKVVSRNDLVQAEARACGLNEWREQYAFDQLSYAAYAFNG